MIFGKQFSHLSRLNAIETFYPLLFHVNYGIFENLFYKTSFDFNCYKNYF
jgi:hypothetical protein